MGTLSKYQIIRGRKLYGIFSVFNSISFTLVTGNILSIYALLLNASALVIGLINAFNFLSFFAIPLGRFLTKKHSIMKVYARAWLARIACVTIMLPIPFFVSSGTPEIGIFCILLSNFGFNFFRGIGTIANNPVINDLAPGKDRGSFLVFLSLSWNTAALLSTLALAFLLQWGDSLFILNAAVTIGIISGVISSLILFKMPSSDTEHTTEATNFSKNFLTAMHDRSFRLFMMAFMIIGFGVGMARPFIIVYAREVYRQPDSFITFITFFSSLGALCMGLVTRLFIDKIGAKPMYLLFTALTIASLIPAVISPSIGNGIIIFIYLCLIAFVSNLGFSGEENAGQTYFFGLIPKESILDLSIVYFLVSGLAGATGSLIAGVMLDAFAQSGLSVTASYRLFFTIQIIIITTSFFIQLKLKALDSYSLKDALPLFFSMRDIRGLSLLYKLDRSSTVRQKTVLLNELRLSNTAVAATNLSEHLLSPSFAVRSEAIAGMESLPTLNSHITDILIKELTRGLYTTAYRAARILGNFKVKNAVPELLKHISSEDYILAGE
ncbi:MAG: MFS transporter, partial [Spirochaetales bacterium]